MAEAKDAVALLKADHREAEELFEKYEKATGDGAKQKIALKVCKALTVHAMIEEEIFYPACEGKIDEADLKEAYVEHDGAKVLSEQIEHHIKEEEARLDGIFAQAKKAGLDMDALGEQLAVRKAELMGEIDDEGLPTPELTTMETTTI